MSFKCMAKEGRWELERIGNGKQVFLAKLHRTY